MTPCSWPSSTLATLTAPRSGVIVERNIVPGQVVAYGQSDTLLNLFVIADLNSIWVLVDVYEPDVPKVHRGQVVTVTLPCSHNDRYEGRVINVAPSGAAELQGEKGGHESTAWVVAPGEIPCGCPGLKGCSCRRYSGRGWSEAGG